MSFSPFSPTASTSSALSSAAHSPAPSTAGSLSAESTHSVATNGAAAPVKRLSCATCRKQKAKCVWIGEGAECELCVKKGVSCPGSAPRAPNRKSTPPGLIPPASALVPSSASSGTSLVSVKWTAQHGSRAPAFSPYHTASGRPRILGPSSSEATLNSWSRANVLKGDLISLYSSMWPLQLNGMPTDSFVELLQGKGDEASKAFVTACIAIGARSSSHSEIVQQVGPSLTLVDEDETGQFTPGGFSEWGVRRHGACVALGNKAIEEARELVRTKPTFRALKVMVAAMMLSSSIDSDRRATRGITLVAVDAFRQFLADPTADEADKQLALNTIGGMLLIRDCFQSISCAFAPAFSPDEARRIIAIRAEGGPVPFFGIPDCVIYSGLIIFDETFMLQSYWKVNDSILYTIASSIFGEPDEPFTAAKAAALRPIVDYMDKLAAEVEERYEQLKRAPDEDVFVLHTWSGSWRPDKPKTHALILITEMLGGFHHANVLIYTRLQLELTAGKLPVDDLAVSLALIEARERARAALKHTARGIPHWLQANRKHATFANSSHWLMNMPGWVDLVLGRVGEPEGPLSKEAEFTVAEVELLVRSLRVGSFSQSSILIALRELESGLEQLRREEMEQMSKAASGLNLNDFWVSGLNLPELAM